MFKLRIALPFKKRVFARMESLPRTATTTPDSFGQDHSRLGAYAALGAIALGAAMLMANIARERNAAPVAAAQAATPAVASAPVVAPAAKPAATPVAVAPSATPAPAAAPEKSVAKIDTTPLGAIAKPAPAKPRHKHGKKPKEVDGNP